MKRFTEASTWAGLAAMFQVGGAMLPQYAFAFHAATVAAGTLAGLIAEKGAKAPAAA